MAVGASGKLVAAPSLPPVPLASGAAERWPMAPLPLPLHAVAPAVITKMASTANLTKQRIRFDIGPPAHDTEITFIGRQNARVGLVVHASIPRRVYGANCATTLYMPHLATTLPARFLLT